VGNLEIIGILVGYQGMRRKLVSGQEVVRMLAWPICWKPPFRIARRAAC